MLKKHKKPVQHHDQDIWSNFCFLKIKFVISDINIIVFKVAKPQNHSKSIGRQLLLLIRGPKPWIDLPQGPNMKLHFCLEIMNSIPCCLLTSPPYVQDTWFGPSLSQLLRSPIRGPCRSLQWVESLQSEVPREFFTGY